jgi:hypothetical protein
MKIQKIVGGSEVFYSFMKSSYTNHKALWGGEQKHLFGKRLFKQANRGVGRSNSLQKTCRW